MQPLPKNVSVPRVELEAQMQRVGPNVQFVAARSVAQEAQPREFEFRIVLMVARSIRQLYKSRRPPLAEMFLTIPPVLPVDVEPNGQSEQPEQERTLNYLELLLQVLPIWRWR